MFDRLFEKFLNLRRLFRVFEFKHPVTVTGFHLEIAAAVGGVHLDLRNRFFSHHQLLKVRAAKRFVSNRVVAVVHGIENFVKSSDDFFSVRKFEDVLERLFSFLGGRLAVEQLVGVELRHRHGHFLIGMAQYHVVVRPNLLDREVTGLGEQHFLFNLLVLPRCVKIEQTNHLGFGKTCGIFELMSLQVFQKNRRSQTNN